MDLAIGIAAIVAFVIVTAIALATLHLMGEEDRDLDKDRDDRNDSTGDEN